MKKQIVLIGAMAFSGSALASHFSGYPDLEQSILNDHAKQSSPVTPQAGEKDRYGSVLLQKPTDTGDNRRHRGATIQSGGADMYGSILYDVRAVN